MSSHQNDQSTDHQHTPALLGNVLELEVNSKESPPVVSSRSSRLLASPRDIICGKGFHIVNHHGNLNLHLIVNEHREVYLSSKRGQKASIIKRILGEIKSTGVRFIRRVSDGNGAEEWEEVDEATAYKKVGHALRLRTKNGSNRGNGTYPAEDRVHSQGDSNPRALNEVRSRCTMPSSTLPSTTRREPPHRHHRSTVQANPTDIICGRGFHIVNHRGNHNLHIMVNTYREEYLKSQRSHKAKIVKHILSEIKSSGAKFIRRVFLDGENSAEAWELVDDATAYKKVSHAFRLRTKNETNRDEDGTTTAADKLHQGDSNTDGAMNQLRSRCTGISATSLPSATNRASAYHQHHQQGNSNSFTLNHLTPSRTTLSVLSVPSVTTHHRKELPTILRESDRLAASSARAAEGSILLNSTERNDPLAGASVGVPLWAAQQPMSQPISYNDILRQQYYHAIGAMMLQLYGNIPS